MTRYRLILCQSTLFPGILAFGYSLKEPLGIFGYLHASLCITGYLRNINGLNEKKESV